MVVVVEEVEENPAMRFHLTCENPNNPESMNRLLGTSDANGAQEGNRTPDVG
jgi:hypothetical protein